MAYSESDSPMLEMASTSDSTLKFRVSTGLKRVLGRELITDDEVATFELVKNSFDAGAKEVYIHFEADAITIADDGSGMSYNDLQNKWLFVAYSSKRNTNRSNGQEDYRDQTADRKQYAGSKGIGRFSSDRLGRMLTLQTRLITEVKDPVHNLKVDWSKFEKNDQDQFDEVSVSYHQANQFNLPEDVPARQHGTVIQISRLIQRWTRDDLLRLKSGLAKLINPFGADVDKFAISIIAPSQQDEDRYVEEKFKVQSPDNRGESPQVVNGRVGNFIFSTLREKTTFIDVTVNSETNTIETSLTDRGEVIYKIREPNKYPLLQNADFRCELYYLNRAAKVTFARRMNIPSVNFGSVFLFRNNFRVFPVGEPETDWFGLDRRKAQGYNRYLGSREVIGRIDVSGTDDKFQEASSRNQGLISTPAVSELQDCFREHCLKRLERYVVPVSWQTKDEIDSLAFIESDNGRARVAASVAHLVGSEDVEVVAYSKRIIDVLNERSDQFEISLVSLRVIANSTGDEELSNRIAQAEARFEELKRAEIEARRIADEERRAKEEARREAEAERRAKEEAYAQTAAAVAEAEEAKEQLVEERKRNLFLTSITSLDSEIVENMHHSITIYSGNLDEQIKNLILNLSGKTTIPTEFVFNRLESIALLNKQVLAIAKFATKANFRLQSEYIEEDLSNYIVSYINEIAKKFIERIFINVETDGKEFQRSFKPIDMSIVVDNLISNASKARATKIEFDIKHPRKTLLEIRVVDNGRGIKSNALSEGRLFEKGFTTTDGSGLGLYHVRQVLSELGGTIEALENQEHGAAFLIRIPR